MARRLLIFAIGFLFGCVLVYVLLFKDTDRDFYGSWLPEGRVLKKIDQNLLRSTERYKCFLDQSQIFPSDLDLLLTEGNVDFERSSTKEDIKSYFVSIDLEDGRNIQGQFALSNDSVWIQQLGIGNLKSWNCD